MVGKQVTPSALGSFSQERERHAKDKQSKKWKFEIHEVAG